MANAASNLGERLTETGQHAAELGFRCCSAASSKCFDVVEKSLRQRHVPDAVLQLGTNAQKLWQIDHRLGGAQESFPSGKRVLSLGNPALLKMQATEVAENDALPTMPCSR